MHYESISITKPLLPKFEELEEEIKEILSTGQITNGKYVSIIESLVAEYIGVKQVVAVSSCTLGLILALQSAGLKGKIIIPSFTFSATGHSLWWNGLEPVFVDCCPNTFNIDVTKIEEQLTEDVSCILAVHIFGNPADVKELEKIAHKYNLYLLFDAAHGFGGTFDGKTLGSFGDAEVFSLSPTKLLVAGEGGLITTNNRELANKIRIARNYGDPGTYNCKNIGLNARMSEFHAILAIKSLPLVKKNIYRRQSIVQRYIKNLSNIPGISFQQINPQAESTFKDFSILIDRDKFGMDRDSLADILMSKNISSRRYFYPPLHRQDVYRKYFSQYDKLLPNTNYVSFNILNLPIYFGLT